MADCVFVLGDMYAARSEWTQAEIEIARTVESGNGVEMGYRGVCKLCKSEKDLIKAHIIPRSLLGAILNDTNPKIYSLNLKGWPRKTQTGIYDTKILCAECDGIIGVWDNYAKDFLQVPMAEVGVANDLIGAGFYEVPISDYSKLKLFFMSLLWRAHLATHEFFGAIDLGPYERRLSEMISKSDPGIESDFAVNLARYFVSEKKYEGLQYVLTAPVKSQGANLNYYKFRIADYVALIKVDQRLFHMNALSPSRNLRVGLLDYLQSEEFSFVTRTKGSWRHGA